MRSEISHRTDFSRIRYAQCWEDADILLEALQVQPGETCLSIGSGGDNTLALLTRNPAKVIAIDLSPAQIACLELRIAAYRELNHAEFLELIGSRPGSRRQDLYRRCRPALPNDVRFFWDSRTDEIESGIGSAGKFEKYFRLFRTRVLPLVHSRRRIEQLLQGGTPQERLTFHERHWDTWRWRLMFRIFFSRFLMGRLGRDSEFFRYVSGNVAERLLHRTKYAVTELNPADNPYLQWILTGEHRTALPLPLREREFDAIRNNLDRIEVKCCSLEQYLRDAPREIIDKFNLSDIFEYISPEGTERILGQLADRGRPGSRLAYWNMLAPRSRPESLGNRLQPLPELAGNLYRLDKAFFYSRFVVEEVL